MHIWRRKCTIDGKAIFTNFLMTTRMGIQVDKWMILSLQKVNFFSLIKEALRKMELDKAIGPDSINNEVLKCLGDKVIEWLTNSIIIEI